MKLKMMLLVVLSIFLLYGCSNNDENVEKNEKEKSEEVTTKLKSENNDGINQNKKLTKKISDEDGVIGGQVYEQDGTAIGTLVLEDEVSDKDAQKLAEKYAEELRFTYKDKKINVQAVKDGKNVANITKE